MYPIAFVNEERGSYTSGMSDELTVKQENACQAFIENKGNRSDAYRTAYHTENMLEKTVWEEACRLFKTPIVAARVVELLEEHRERHNVTVDSLTEELDQAWYIASLTLQPGAMTGATMGKAKIHGMIIDKAKVDHTSKDGSMTPRVLDTSLLSTKAIKELLKARESAGSK